MKIGSKVVCIDASNIDARIPNKPEHMANYTIRDIINYVVNKPGEVGVLLKEIENPKVDVGLVMKFEPTFNIKRFAEMDESEPIQEEVTISRQLERAGFEYVPGDPFW